MLKKNSQQYNIQNMLGCLGKVSAESEALSQGGEGDI